MTKRNEIIAACKAIEPNPEHGPSQYGVVITYLRDDEGVDFSKMTTKDAVSAVLGHMNISQRSSAVIVPKMRADVRRNLAKLERRVAR